MSLSCWKFISIVLCVCVCVCPGPCDKYILQFSQLPFFFFFFGLLLQCQTLRNVSKTSTQSSQAASALFHKPCRFHKPFLAPSHFFLLTLSLAHCVPAQMWQGPSTICFCDSTCVGDQGRKDSDYSHSHHCSQVAVYATPVRIGDSGWKTLGLGRLWNFMNPVLENTQPFISLTFLLPAS